MVKVDAYNDIKSYLAECSGTSIESLDDVVAYNDANSGSEGAFAHEHPAFPSGQVSTTWTDRVSKLIALGQFS